MGEIRLDHCCRLCLKEGFSLTNIFSHRSADGDLFYQILNFIYDIKIYENDGLPSQICSPCMWRMIEFDSCKKNVRSADTEIRKLMSRRRNHSNKVSSEDLVKEARKTEMGEGRKLRIEHGAVHSEVLIKEEVDTVECEMPVEIVMKVPEPVQHFEEADDYHEGETPEEEPVEVPAEEYEGNFNQQVFCQPLRECSGSSDVRNSPSLEDSKESAERGKSRVNVTYLEQSRLEDLSVKKSGFNCDICKKNFQGKVSLGQHMRIHYNERHFSCGVCGKKFKQNIVRYNHELKHLRDELSVGKRERSETVYGCGICGKMFNYKSNLREHCNQHSDKYPCGACGKCFGSSTRLKRHSRIHTQERPFKCELCVKSFVRKDLLKQHMSTHTTERPFSCSGCDKTFKSKRVRTQHELLHFRKD